MGGATSVYPQPVVDAAGTAKKNVKILFFRKKSCIFVWKIKKVFYGRYNHTHHAFDHAP